MLRDLLAYENTLHLLSTHKYITEQEELDSNNIILLERVWEYLDDIAIQKFFEVSLQNRPFFIDNSILKFRYSIEGKQPITEPYRINFADDYDRATFLAWLINWWHIRRIEYDPIRDLREYIYPCTKKDAFGSFFIGLSPHLNGTGRPLYSIEERKIYNEYSKLSQLYDVAEYMLEEKSRSLEIFSLMDELKNVTVVPGYTVNDLLFIYCLIVEKLKISERNISFIFSGLINPGFLRSNSDKNSVMYLFFLFESKIDYIFNYEEDMDPRDLFYRFANKKTGKAFSISKSIEKSIVDISLFDQESVSTVYCPNTLLLPYHIHAAVPSKFPKIRPRNTFVTG